MLYLLSRGLIYEGDGPALANAELVMALERGVGLFVEPVIQEWGKYLTLKPLVVLLNWVYIVTYWPVILGVAFLLYLARRATYVRYRRLIAVHLVLALTLFALFPLAPPFKNPVPGGYHPSYLAPASTAARTWAGFTTPMPLCPAFTSAGLASSPGCL